ncbi:MAG: hypothetical protein AAFX81_20205 [Pseudomonadota bacterium]
MATARAAATTPTFTLRTGLVLALLAGVCWGLVGVLVVAIALMLVTGAPVVPSLGAGVAAGLVAALICLFVEGGWRQRAMAAGAAAATLVLLTAGQPFGLPADVATLAQAVSLAVLAACLALLIGYVMGDVTPGAMRRYAFEVVVIRLLKGLGLLAFGVFVFLPFYVMVMTSFKSQAELLANPLDFSM